MPLSRNAIRLLSATALIALAVWSVLWWLAPAETFSQYWPVGFAGTVIGFAVAVLIVRGIIRRRDERA